MKRYPLRPRLFIAMSLVAALLPGCSSKSNNVKSGMPASDLGVASDQSAKSSRSKKEKGTSPGSQYDTLWERLFSLYALPKVEHRSVDREVSWFVNHEEYLRRAQQRAEPFLYTIVRQLEKQKMPGELALLPIVESAFQPHAVSPARAAGIWQFIPETGRRYGLKRSRSYDGRRDVYASTRAAIKYLKKLHRDFDGDWLLAVAAYNCGEGAVAKAIQRNEARNLPTDFWSLDLPDETKAYVPRLLAVSKVLANSDRYDVDLHYIPNEAIFKPVKVSSQLDLALAADAADISLEKMLALNPGFKHKHADIEGPYRLFVPADKSRKFKKELARLAMAGQFESRSEASIDAVQTEGDRTDSARSRYGYMADETSPAQERMSGESDYASGRSYQPGRSQRAAARVANREDRWHGAVPVGRERSMVVAYLRDEAGFVDDDMGRGHGRGVKANKGKHDRDEQGALSKRGNHAEKDDDGHTQGRFSRGKTGPSYESHGAGHKDKHSVSRLPEHGHGNGVNAGQSIHHTVKPGETLFAISQRFGVSVADLRKWNGVKENKVEAGRNIKISAGKD